MGMTTLIQIQQQPNYWKNHIHSKLDELGIEGTTIVRSDPRTNAFCFIAELMVNDVSLESAAKQLVAEMETSVNESQKTTTTKVYAASPG